MNVQQATSQANTLPAIHTPTTAATATTFIATSSTSTSTSDTPMEPLGRIDKFPMANIEFPIDSSTFTKEALLTHMRSAKEEANYLEQNMMRLNKHLSTKKQLKAYYELNGILFNLKFYSWLKYWSILICLNLLFLYQQK
ncbi:unnamed protein product [Rhizopus microsporus]